MYTYYSILSYARLPFSIVYEMFITYLRTNQFGNIAIKLIDILKQLIRSNNYFTVFEIFNA